MFAPQPVPQSVRELYDRTIFLGNRIDNPNITVGGLVLIAALATRTVLPTISKPAEVDLDEVSETWTPQQDVVVANDTVPAAQTLPEQSSVPEPMNGPLGPMDAPQGPTTESGKNGLEIALSGMSKAELVSHAIDVCGMTKKQILGRNKKGRATKSDFNFTCKAKIIERILGKNNG